MAYIFRSFVVSRANGFPSSGAATEVPEGLGHLERLDDDPLLLLVVANLGVARHGEILAQRVAVEAVIGHDAPEIGVTDEEDTEEVVDLALVPVGAVVQVADTGHGGGLVGICLDPQTRVVADAQHVVDDLEALVLGGVVDGGDVGHLGVLGGGVVLEEGEDGDDAGGRDADGQLVLPDGEPAAGERGPGWGWGWGRRAYCWMYLGRHDMRYWPYLCRASPFSLYLSVGLTMAAFCWAGEGSRGACWRHCQRLGQRSRGSSRSSSSCTYAQVRHVLAVAGYLLRPQRAGCKGAHRHRGARAGRRAHGVAQWPSKGLAQGHCVCCRGGEAACSGVGGEGEGRRRSWASSSVVRRSFLQAGSPLLLLELAPARDSSAERAFQICFARPLTPRPPSPASFPLGSYSRSAFVLWSRLLSLHLACPLSPGRSTLPPPQPLSHDATLTARQPTPTLTSHHVPPATGPVRRR